MNNNVLGMIFRHRSKYMYGMKYDYHEQYGDEYDTPKEEMIDGREGNFLDAAIGFLATLDPADVYGIVEKKRSFKVYYVRKESKQ